MTQFLLSSNMSRFEAHVVLFRLSAAVTLLRRFRSCNVTVVGFVESRYHHPPPPPPSSNTHQNTRPNTIVSADVSDVVYLV